MLYYLEIHFICILTGLESHLAFPCLFHSTVSQWQHTPKQRKKSSWGLSHYFMSLFPAGLNRHEHRETMLRDPTAVVLSPKTCGLLVDRQFIHCIDLNFVLQCKPPQKTASQFHVLFQWNRAQKLTMILNSLHCFNKAPTKP